MDDERPVLNADAYDQVVRKAPGLPIRHLIDAAAVHKAQLADEYAAGVREWTNDRGGFAVVTPEPTTGQGLRVTRYTADGLFGHATFPDEAGALRYLYDLGMRTPAPGTFDKFGAIAPGGSDGRVVSRRGLSEGRRV